jgi:hypothetical protein
MGLPELSTGGCSCEVAMVWSVAAAMQVTSSLSWRRLCPVSQFGALPCPI